VRELAELDGPVDRKDPKAGTLRKHLESVARQGARRDPRLDGGKAPEGLEYLLGLWLEVRGGASDGFSGPRLTWRDLADYQAVTGIALDAFEVEAMMAMERAVQDARAKE
jgi:hypothetical protein